MKELILDVKSTARTVFKGKPTRVWFAMKGPEQWATYVIDAFSKEKLSEGPVSSSPEGSLHAMKSYLDSIAAKQG